MTNKKPAMRASLAVIMLAVILGGCGQRGPLTLPERQFPTPADSSRTEPAAPNPSRP